MKDGFTLTEIIIVVIIIGILATIGVSQYYPAKERALGKEAIANLKLISAAEKIYRMEANPQTYYPPSSTVFDIADINKNLKLSLTGTNWDYAIAGGEKTFAASARRKGAGGYLNCEYRITQGVDDPFVEFGPCP